MDFIGIGFPELVLILVIAGIVMGPERIGHVARWLGKTTAQLQAISRGFVRQLQNELDGSDGGEALQEAMTEVQTLRRELETLRADFTSVANDTRQEGKAALQEVENSIQPPTLKPTRSTSNQQETPLPADNSQAENKSPPALPTLKHVPDDPE